MQDLLQANARVRVATKAFSASTYAGLRAFQPGALIVQRGVQSAESLQDIVTLLDRAALGGLAVSSLDSTMTSTGPDLGSINFVRVEAVRPHLAEAGLWTKELDGPRADWLWSLLGLLQPRCRRLPAFVDQARPFLDPSDELEYEDKPARKHLKGDDVATRIRATRERFTTCEDWTPTALEDALRALAEETGVSAGKLIHPIRLAVTGRGASPGLFEVLELLGRDRSLKRIDRLIDRIEAGLLPPGPA